MSWLDVRGETFAERAEDLVMVLAVEALVAFAVCYKFVRDVRKVLAECRTGWKPDPPARLRPKRFRL